MLLKAGLFALAIALPGTLSAASSTPPDLIALAKAADPSTFDHILAARFGPANDTRYEAFKTWVLKLTPEELARLYRQTGTLPDGKPRLIANAPCTYLDQRGFSRAIIAAVDKTPDRVTAEKIWREVETAYVAAPALEQTKLAEARVDAIKRPTAIGKELAMRTAPDQAWREAQFIREHDAATSEAIMIHFASRECHIDSDNTAWLKSVVAKGQWPLISRDGKDAAHEAWLLVQHADDDTDFQEQVLTMLEPLVAKHEAAGKDYAYLYDRVALARNRPQRYATQFASGKDGCMLAMKTEDPAGVEARRAAAGMTTLADYVKLLTENYHAPACKDLFGEPAS